MLSNIVDLSELPTEILERIVSKLSPEEICANIRQISHRFEEVAYNVMKTLFRGVQPLIENELGHTKGTLKKKIVNTDTFQNEMALVAKFTFLQILHSEYRILSTIIFESESVTHSTIIFKIVKNIDEFHNLINNLKRNQWDWRADNVADVLDKLRTLNSEICDEFFWKSWSIDKNPFGPMLIKLLDCSISSKFQVAISHASHPKFKDSKCHLSGNYEIPDLSNTLVSPPPCSQNPYHCTRMLAAYICDSIRWGNLFHSLRLKWLCMVRALALSKGQSTGWPLFDPGDPYLNSMPNITQEKEITLSNSEKKTCRIIEQLGEDTRNIPLWLGMRYNFQLWCPIKNAPKEMFGEGQHTEILRLKEENNPSPRPYLFKLEFRVYVTAASSISQGAVETTIWIEETPEQISYTQSRQLRRFSESTEINDPKKKGKIQKPIAPIILPGCGPVVGKSSKKEMFWNNIAGAELLIKVSDNNFEEILNKHKAILIVFYGTWCSVCKDVNFEIGKAAKLISSVDGAIGVCDAMDNVKAVDKFLITKTPSFKYFRNGKYIADYIGRPLAEDIICFMKYPPSTSLVPK